MKYGRYFITIAAALLVVMLCALLIPDKTVKKPKKRSTEAYTSSADATEATVPQTAPSQTASASPEATGHIVPSPSGQQDTVRTEEPTEAPSASGPSGSAPESTTSGREETAVPSQGSSSEPAAPSQGSSSEATESSAPESTEQPSVTETPQPSSEQEARTADYSTVAFIGDSRFFTLRSDGRPPYGLVPDSKVFAEYGGTLISPNTYNNAYLAGYSGCSKAVFWFGINDVRVDTDRDNADLFVIHYKDVIVTFRNEDPDAEIIVLSVLNTGTDDPDYYEGQDENILQYNTKMRAYCEANGYTFLDITRFFTGDDCLLDDHIHFTEAFYTDRLLPYLCEELGLYR